MKTAAMTRIHRSETLLKTWLSYYSRYFDELIVFAGMYEGKEPFKFEELAQKYPFQLIDVKDDFYNMNTHQKVFAKQRELLVDHSWVLYSDADEIVVADPEKYDGLRHYMDTCKEDQTFCHGYEVFQADDEEPIDYDKPLLSQRKFWCKDATRSYHKPCLSRIPTDWGEGFHYIQGMEGKIDEIQFMGLYLVHLKPIDPTREFDFPRGATGNHGDKDFKTDSQPIPEKIRRIF